MKTRDEMGRQYCQTHWKEMRHQLRTGRTGTIRRRPLSSSGDSTAEDDDDSIFTGTFLGLYTNAENGSKAIALVSGLLKQA